MKTCPIPIVGGHVSILLKPKVMFVIRGRIKGSETWKYLTVDCSYYTFTERVNEAHIFNTYEECVKVINSDELNKNQTAYDGVITPSYGLHRLSGVNKQNKSADVELHISQIKFDDMLDKEIHCEIKEPSKVIYQYD